MPTLNLQVGNSTHDAREQQDGDDYSHTATQNTATYINASSVYDCACRWTGTSNLDGATIETATVDVYCVQDDDPNGMFFYGEDVDSTLFFSATNDVNSRYTNRTTASASWPGSALGINTWLTSPDCTNIIQEIVDRPSWNASGGITLVWHPTSLSHDLRFSSYDSSSTNAAKLDIDYSTGPAMQILTRHVIDQCCSQ